MGRAGYRVTLCEQCERERERESGSVKEKGKWDKRKFMKSEKNGIKGGNV